jgi:WD40 repeat protein
MRTMIAFPLGCLCSLFLLLSVGHHGLSAHLAPTSLTRLSQPHVSRIDPSTGVIQKSNHRGQEIDQLVTNHWMASGQLPELLSTGPQASSQELRLLFVDPPLDHVNQHSSPMEHSQANAFDRIENDFDTPGVGTPYLTTAHSPPPAPTAALVNGGPSGEGKALRLAYALPSARPQQNSLIFDPQEVEPAAQVVADFDFRIRPGTGRADGFGFALLNTAHYPLTGTVPPGPPNFAAEEPDFAGSLGIGFDIYRSILPDHKELNANHLSIHFNGTRLAEVDAGPAIDLAIGEWVHARMILHTGNGQAAVTVQLSQCGRAPVTVIEHFPIPGLTPYQSRLYLAARSGGLNADYDFDNVRVHFLDLHDTLISFQTGCAGLVESGGALPITVVRMGDTTSVSSVRYTTTNQLAVAGVDFEPASGVVRFQGGEISRTILLTLTNDLLDEEDEHLLIHLSESTDARIGGPATMRVTIIDDEAGRRLGHWGAPFASDVVAIHAHLLPTGKVMYWDRQNEKGHHETVPPERDYGWDGNPRLWDPLTGELTRTAVISYDLFCGGHAFLADGSLLVAGGHYTGIIGLAQASLYHPLRDTWERLPDMNAGRWYPSNVTLPNGDVLVVAGTNEAGVNHTPQVWQIATQNWRSLTGATHVGLPTFPEFYPFLFVAPNGQVFNAGPQPTARYLDPAGTGRWTEVATSRGHYREYGSAVMYDEGKVLIVGGTPLFDGEATESDEPTASAEIIDLNAATPIWRSAGSMYYSRRNLNTTLLPDGTVLVTGGSRAPGFDNPAGAILAAELWNPTTEGWRELAGASRYRGYHSIALLLPDARVLVGGGGHPNAQPGGAQTNFEIFSPPYLFRGARPVIASAPTTVTYGLPFPVATSDANRIGRVTWIRLSSVTHSFNQSQRINQLSFRKAPGALWVAAPSDPNRAPPGHYLLFLLDEQGVPSVAHMLQLVPNQLHLPLIYNQKG